MPAPYIADLRWRVIWFAMLSRGQLVVRKAVSVGSLRAAACKYQTSPDSSKKSTSILFHEKNPFIETFSKMEFKTFSEFHFFRPDESWR